MPRRFTSWFLRCRVALCLAAVLLLVGILVPQAWAWYHLRTARAELAKSHPHEARAALDRCERVWGNRVSVRLLACRAAWQEGQPEAALQEVRIAQRLSGGATPETAFEWALLQASAGNVREVEVYLQKQAEQSPETAGPLVWEALSVGYLNAFRTIDAMACLSHWLNRDKENIRALELRGATRIAGKGLLYGSADYQRVLELDPNRWATRWRLIDALLTLGNYPDAAKHLEMFATKYADDPAVASRLARCYNILGRTDEARSLVENALAKHPDDAGCLRTRGQLAMTARNPDLAAAESDLRKAVALAPEDYQGQNLLFQALQQQGKVEEARARLKIAEEIRERSERISELTSRKLAEFPLDPAFHYELGKLQLESNRLDSAFDFLQAALKLDPNHKPSHAALAEYYERKGDKAKAAFHRGRAADADK